MADKIPYNPTAPMREQKVGKALVVGNDSYATVCKVGLVRQMIEEFDNAKPHNGDASAFNRAVKWAQDNPNDKRLAGGMFG